MEVFRNGKGAAKAALLEENRTKLKGGKRKAKELGLSINAAKRVREGGHGGAQRRKGMGLRYLSSN